MCVRARVMRYQNLMLCVGAFCFIALHAVEASAQVVVGSWRLDVNRSQLNPALAPYRETFQQHVTISLIDGAVKIDILTTGVPWRVPVNLVLTPGCCFEPPPGPGTPQASATGRQFADTHLYLVDGIAHPFDVLGDIFPPDRGVRSCVWLPDLSGFDVSEDWLEHQRRQRFRTSADGNRLTIDTVETYRGGAAGSLVRGFVREQ